MLLRYVIDENLRGPIWTALVRANTRRAEPLQLACVGDESDLPLGTSDPELLRWAEDHGFIMVSSDVCTMPGHLRDHLEAGLHSPGVFLVTLPCSIPQVIEALMYYADESEEALWQDSLHYIP